MHPNRNFCRLIQVLFRQPQYPIDNLVRCITAPIWPHNPRIERLNETRDYALLPHFDSFVVSFAAVLGLERPGGFFVASHAKDGVEHVALGDGEGGDVYGTIGEL